jgi:hypothetical protein
MSGDGLSEVRPARAVKVRPRQSSTNRDAILNHAGTRATKFRRNDSPVIPISADTQS